MGGLVPEPSSNKRPQPGLIINNVIYAEISTRHSTVETIDAMLRDLDIGLVAIRALRSFWLAKPIYDTAPMVAFAPACCPISSSAPTRRSDG